MAYKNWYDIFISPLLSGLNQRVAAQIDKGANVLEVGCGTGELARALFIKGVSSYTGVDLTPKMITAARSKVSNPNFNFIADDFLNVSFKSRFDYAVFPMIIHSVDKGLAQDLITKAISLADNIIIADYIVPQPTNYKALLVRFIERLAGKEHYQSFKEFKLLGGSKHYASNLSLEVINSLEYEVFQISFLQTNGFKMTNL